jgi:hydroxypyruvate isomerase
MPTMPRLAANVSTMFTEVPFLDRFGRAAKAGFRFVEMQFPYDHAAGDVRARLDEHGLAAVLHNLPPGDFGAGERGIACLPGREAEFRDSVERGIEVALTLGVPQLHVLSGKVPAGVAPASLRPTLVANLRHAAERLHAAGLKMLVEPINTFDMPGYWLHHSAQALALLDEVGAPNAFLQYDCYHMQRMEGELAATIQKHLARIAHVQIADNPGRHEPGTGEINHPFLLDWLVRIGYTGFVGCEYNPAAGTEAGLGWAKGLLG